MTGPAAVKIVLSERERGELETRVRRRKIARADAMRAEIVLLAADGLNNCAIADEIGVSRMTVLTWRKRFAAQRLDGLDDEPRCGAPRKIGDGKITDVVAKTLETMPSHATHWSTRSMAKGSGLSVSTVHRIWNAFSLQPHRSETFKLSTDPRFVEKVRDIIGLYLDPPERALVLCVDEKSQIQALDRTQLSIGVDDAAWDHSVFSKNRERLLEGDIAAKLLSAVLAQPRAKRLLSTDHFSVDGTLIEAWASMKSFKPKDGSDEPPADGGGRNRETDFHGEKRSNDTHASTTDPEARLYRKGPGKEAKLCFMGHALMENRNGLVVDACLTLADGHAERIAALHMIEPRADRPNAITLGADKAYDAEDFVNELRTMNATPHVAQNVSGRSSAIDGRTTRHAGYAVSQRIRKRIEEAFGWIKTIAGQEKTKFRGRERVGWAFAFAAAAYNLVRLPKLMAAPT